MNNNQTLPKWVICNLEAIDNGFNKKQSILNLFSLMHQIKANSDKKNLSIIYNALVEKTNDRYDNLALTSGFYKIVI